MKKTRFTESQIVAAIKKQKIGIAVKDLCRELSISEAPSYNWKAKYGGMEVSELKRVKTWKRNWPSTRKCLRNVLRAFCG